MTRQNDGGETTSNTRDGRQGSPQPGQPGHKDMASWKPGSEASEAKNVTSPGDFGVPVGAGPSRERDYVSGNTQASDPGAAQPRASEFEGRRTAGAGGNFNGDGSGSGGDLDADVVGVGTGSGLSADGPGDASGPDDSDGSSDEFASGGRAQGRNQTKVGRVGAGGRVPGGTTVSRDIDITTGADGQTSDNVNNPARDDDSFAGEVTLGEAEGEDQPMPPSPDAEGADAYDSDR
jgi:hypothetical protein